MKVQIGSMIKLLMEETEGDLMEAEEGNFAALAGT